MPLSEIKSYVVVLSLYIKMIKRRTHQVSSSKHSIKKAMLFSLEQIETILVGQVGSFKHTLVDATVWKKHQISLVLGKNANKIL